MDGGSAEAWLIPYTQQLRSRLPSPQFLITHAPVSTWFSDQPGRFPGGGYLFVDKQVGNLIDWYNTQFYKSVPVLPPLSLILTQCNSQGAGEYSDCGTLLYHSNKYPHASLFEIAANGVPLNKVVVGKPGSFAGAFNGFMDTSTLNNCMTQAEGYGYEGGLAVYEYTYAPYNFVAAVRPSLPLSLSLSRTRTDECTLQSWPTGIKSAAAYRRWLEGPTPARSTRQRR